MAVIKVLPHPELCPDGVQFTPKPGVSLCTALLDANIGIEHACAGENACRGKGWIKVARSECDEKKGEVLG